MRHREFCQTFVNDGDASADVFPDAAFEPLPTLLSHPANVFLRA
jgi:hypothetical protein